MSFALRPARSLIPRRPRASFTPLLLLHRHYASIPGFPEDKPEATLEPSPNTSYDEGPPTANPAMHPKQPAFNPIRAASENEKGLASDTVLIQHYLHVTCTPNNTLITLCGADHTPVKSGVWTGGSCQFKGAQRGQYEAGYQCAKRAFDRMAQIAEKDSGSRFEILFSGSGKGREAVVQALMMSEGEQIRGLVNRVTDKTPIKIGGPRAKKTRRV